MSEAQIESHAEDFGRAAARVKDCGFDMLVIHGGHGWLLHQFLSPLTNKRNDAFGGSLENRMRFPLMVADRVREAVGADFPVEFRMSADERMEGGYGAETGIGIALLLDGRVDLIHVSAGSNMDMYSAALMHPGCFQSHGENGVYAARIKRRVRTPVISVGAFSEPDKMESFLAEGHADCLALGRALIADPFLPKKALLGRTEDITPCLRCGECQGGMFATRTMRCSVNPVIGSERAYFSPPPAPARRKKVLVAGGGPAGLSAAIAAAERGHEVILCEARPALGGALKFADFLEFKGNVRRFREHLISRARRLRVDIRLGTRADAALVEKEKPDALIAACGALPVVPPIPGICGANVLRASSLERDTPVGRRVVVIGGGLIGCETALQLAGGDHDVQIIEMKPEAAEDCAPFHRVNLLRQMEKAARLSLSTGLRCLSVDGKGVYARDAEGEERFFPVDTVILAAGMKADEDELERLRPLVPLFYAVGDARRARKIMHAVRDGTNAAVDLGLPLS
jgi:NADPH-dependent 2,4-dienoyl-CoA reductase/sulfur reductase-like enzyme